MDDCRALPVPNKALDVPFKAWPCFDIRYNLTMEPEAEIELTRPGEMLREDFLEPMGLTAYQLSKSLGVQQTRISEILRGQRDISPQTSLLLDKFFGLSDGYWLRLQADYNLRKARRGFTEKLDKVQPYRRL